MNDARADRTHARLVEVRTVEVISGRGRSVTLSSVRCPVRGRSAMVEACVECAPGSGIAQDALAHGEYLSCCGGPGERPSAPASGPRAAVGAIIPRAAIAVRATVARDVAADALRARGLASAAVVDGDGRPIGFVSEADLLRTRAGATVAEAMTHVAPAVPESATVARALSLMAGRRADRLAVVASDGVVVGVLAASDVIAWLADDAAALA